VKKLIKILIDVLPLLLSVIGCIYVLCGGKQLVKIPSDTNFHFSLITVNALFGGFLYTNYSLLIGLLDNDIVEKIKSTNIIHKRNIHILKGIIYSTFSVVSGLCFVLIPPSDSKIQSIMSCFMGNVEITFMAFVILYFTLSLREMKILIDSVHYSKNAKSEEEIQSLKAKIKGNHKNAK